MIGVERRRKKLHDFTDNELCGLEACTIACLLSRIPRSELDKQIRYYHNKGWNIFDYFLDHDVEDEEGKDEKNDFEKV